MKLIAGWQLHSLTLVHQQPSQLLLFVVRSGVLSQQAGKVLNKKKGGEEMILVLVYCVVKYFLLSVSNYSPIVHPISALPSVFSLMSGKTMF